MNEQDEKLFQLTERLRKATSDPGEMHVCPICGGCLHVEFAPYMRESKPMLGIHVFCESCGITEAIDAAQPPPQWLKKPLSQAIT